MALSTRLMMRQGQSLVMTPQLLQAIKLLQFSHLELSAFVQDELDRNPLLERADDAPAPDAQPSIDRYGEAERAEPAGEAPDWARQDLPVDGAQLSGDLGTDVSNAFEPDAAPTPAAVTTPDDPGLSASAWTGSPGTGSGGGDGEASNLEAYVAAKPTLAEHLSEQFMVACVDPVDRLIGQTIIDSLDEYGYFRDSLAETAHRLGVAEGRVETVLKTIQTLDPSGVGARDLAECLAIQLRERDRCDPAMQALLANLPLLARREFATLRRLCGVDDEDLVDMLAEIRRLDPKPGRAFGGEPIQPVAPDVVVRPAADGGWRVELNTEVLPRVLVNQTYAATVNSARASEADKTFLATCLQNANWLTKSLEQRARTILKVSSEIVRQQDGFLAHGVEHLRPLNLRTIADAIGMHESTVSRVTSNKYMATPRGLFEMKYFFTASIPAQAGAEAHSAEAVRFRIKQMIEQERAENILSDDAIVTRLKEANIDIARRTVAKYRESLRIPSSVERRREKMAAQLQSA
ncbi:MAG: RNA polymerase factor sigma-54 [Hyphomicrobiales bacterium]|nr:RNA polymerase factor sigma-54 [Hyphomicrobiales bacterium]